MTEEVERAFAFMRKGDIAGEIAEPFPHGTRVRSPTIPLRYDSNYLLVDDPRSASADELVAEAERSGLRLILVPDEAAGARLADGFRERAGWRIDRHLVMVLRRPAERTADLSPVDEVDEAALRPLRERTIVSQPWGSPELAAQLLAAKPLIARRVTARFYAVRVGGEVVACSDLYYDGESAQVEDVATVEEHRGRGYATALVLRAVADARAAGNDFVFLVADDEDWPKELYRRLGFDDAGRYWKFIASGNERGAV